MDPGDAYLLCRCIIGSAKEEIRAKFLLSNIRFNIPIPNTKDKENVNSSRADSATALAHRNAVRHYVMHDSAGVQLVETRNFNQTFRPSYPIGYCTYSPMGDG